MIALLLALFVSGCALTHTTPDGHVYGVYPGLAPSDEVQTGEVTIIGVSVDAARDSIDIGYKKIRMTRVPAFDKPALVPSVTTTTSVNSSFGTSITDTLKVGEKP